MFDENDNIPEQDYKQNGQPAAPRATSPFFASSEEEFESIDAESGKDETKDNHKTDIIRIKKDDDDSIPLVKPITGVLRPDGNRDVDDQNRKMRQTAILPKDGKLFKRALHHQQTGGGTANLDGKREVILVIRGVIERVVMSEGVRYRLGRFDASSREAEDIDLSPYGAMDKGVSRVHATLHLEGEYLHVTDLNSTNGTFLAGVRLPANIPTVLRKGDELLVARLAVQIMFR